jgi:hypothetical protein
MKQFDPSAIYMKNPGVVAAGSDERYVFIRSKGEPLIFEPPAAHLISRLMSLVCEPIKGVDLQTAYGSDGDNLTNLILQLVQQRIIIVGTEEKISSLVTALGSPVAQQTCNHLVVGITGAIQAALVFHYLDQIYFRFCHNLDVILTKAALNFVNPRAFEYMYDARVWVDTFRIRRDVNVPHIHLAELAELILVFPTTAHLLHRLATGECSDLLSLVIVATKAPVILVPAMNKAMWFHPSIQRNVRRLREDGFYIVEPGLGYEASAKHEGTLEIGGPGVDAPSLVELLKTIYSLESNIKSKGASK